MERYCANCIHRGYRKDDTLMAWPYCIKQGIREAANKVIIEAPRELPLWKEPIHEGNIPSCNLVQTLFDGKCPYKEEEQK